MTPGLLLAPGWSHIPDVGIVLAAKCQEINGYFSCEGFIDIGSTASGCTRYSGVKAAKEAAGCTNTRIMALWPCVAAGSRKFWYSAVMGAVTAYVDATNDDVPSLSPSNKLVGVTGTVLGDAVYTENENGGGTWDKEVVLDQLQGNAVNSVGVTTAINVNGWRTWGNRTATYPANTDPKDMWSCCRRFFSWWGNSFILTYFQKMDDPANRRLIETIVDTENKRGAAYVADGKCARAEIEFNADENLVTNLIDGKLRFHQHLTPYPPAEDILNVLEFDFKMVDPTQPVELTLRGSIQYTDTTTHGAEEMGMRVVMSGRPKKFAVGTVSALPDQTVGYVCFIASRISDQPIEFFLGLAPRDMNRVKNKVTGFFYGAE